MRRASRGWIIVILIALLLSVIFLTPTFLGDMLPGWWGKVFPQKGLRLGLDLRGGIYLLLGVRAENAVEQELSNMKELMNEELAKDKVLPKSFQNSGKTLTISFFSKSDLEKTRKLESDYKEIADINEKDLSLSFTLKDQYIKELQKRAIDQVKETIQNRIDEFGVVEPSIQKAGADRLLAKYNVTTPDELLSQGFRLHPGNPKDVQSENEKFFITESDAQVTGQYLSDARLIFDEYGRPAVGFGFRGEGASKFGKLTGDNIGQRLAIVLDGTIKSAPVIQERISSQGRITGTFTLDEAKDLALVLRSGALPVPVDVEQEQTVGPSLGRDSIEKGKLSMIVGGIAVVLFMMIFYRLQGVIANIALAFNMLFIMGFLSSFGVTLTLPGIAGLVLTVGMAVDGNVII